MKNFLSFVYFLFLAVVILVSGFYPANKAVAQLSSEAVQVLCNIVTTGGYTEKIGSQTNYYFTDFLPQHFPGSAVVQDAKKYSNWNYAGQTQESSYATNLEAIFFTTIFPEEPTDANNRTSSMTEIYLDITIPGSLCSPPVDPEPPLGFNIFNKKALAQTIGSGAPAENLAPDPSNTQIFSVPNGSVYAKQTYVDTSVPEVRFTKLKRTIKLNAIDSENTKITVVPEIIQDNLQMNYVRYGKVEDSYIGDKSHLYPSVKFCVDEWGPVFGKHVGYNCYYRSSFYDPKAIIANTKGITGVTYVIKWLMPVNGNGNFRMNDCYLGYSSSGHTLLSIYGDVCNENLTSNTPDNRSSWNFAWVEDGGWARNLFAAYHWLPLYSGYSCVTGVWVDGDPSYYDPGTYCAPSYGSQLVPIMIEEGNSPYLGFKNTVLDSFNSIVVSAVEKNEEILIVNAPVCQTNSDSGLTHSYVDTHCWRQGISLDGRVGSGQWHYYSSGNGYLGDFFGGIIEMVTMGLSNIFIHISEAESTLIPSLMSLSAVESDLLLNSFAKDVIDKYTGGRLLKTSPQTYNLGFLGTVSESKANPTKYFGASSGSDGNVWNWYGKFRELPTVTLKGPARVELPDKINLDWRTPTNSDTCVASGDWSGVKATSSIVGPLTESLIKMKGNYVFNISCSNVAGVATSSVRTEVKRVPRCDFSANPSSIVLPEFSTLKWDCTYDDPDVANLYPSGSADSCSIDNGIGNVSNVSGSEQVRPRETTTYRLTCISDTSKTYPATVSVDAPTGGAVKEVRP